MLGDLHLACDHANSFTHQKGFSNQIFELQDSGLPQLGILPISARKNNNKGKPEMLWCKILFSSLSNSHVWSQTHERLLEHIGCPQQRCEDPIRSGTLIPFLLWPLIAKSLTTGFTFEWVVHAWGVGRLSRPVESTVLMMKAPLSGWAISWLSTMTEDGFRTEEVKP